MSSLARRVALMGGLVAILGLLAFVTVRTTRPSSITAALARGQSPEAPRFALPRLDAEGTLDLASLRGRVVVINFWASWCIPCREEARALESTWQQYRDRDVIVIGVNVQDLTHEAQKFLSETKSTYPQVRDRENTSYRAYGLTGIPETFFVDRAGRIVRKFPGVVTDLQTWARAVEDARRR